MAEEASSRGLLVTEDNRYKYFFWKIIANCKRLKGDKVGESEAAENAKKYK
jgi:hypothetical protein